ncbi:phosphodiester glycosidase family protein [Roseibacillus persicicus]|uniref:Phosphodiester glycosidase domain-containing protein n=1 Tax=Roseibacillus persicicus TaxID=454148 RepID=A0A918TBZ5_9BACT|nr:phosphodiester glycosidase family protein [Roseibacillus persicicus]GHC42284.1 hypothetical protein GCM10007100_04070 [Roseibacillus persicicus]
MRSIPLFLFAIALVSCAPEPTAPEPVNQPATLPVRAQHYPGNSQPITPDGTTPADTSRHPLRVRTGEVAGASITYLTFDTRTHTLEVFDQGGVGTKHQTAGEVTRSQGALAGINGGFFTPEGNPLGVLYHQGEKVGSLNTASSLGSGVLYVDKKLAQPVLARRESFQKWLKDPAFDPKEVLQTGPFLVESGKAVSGLSNDEARVRSLLLWDGKYHFAIAQCEAITLRNLAGGLVNQPLGDFRVAVALNLDGGRSSDLSISSKVAGGPRDLRRWWNKPVRNYVLLKPQ